MEENLTGSLHDGQTTLLAGVQRGSDSKPGSPLERALWNIEEHFAAVGTTERFDESLVAFSERLGWDRPFFFVPENRTPNRPAKSSIDPETVELIERHNQLDRRLYEHVTQCLEADLRALGPRLAAELLKIRMRCGAYRALRAGLRLVPTPLRSTLATLRKNL